MVQKPRIPGVFKNVIAPVQVWLLSQNRCVGCGRELTSGNNKRKGGSEKIICVCGRIFIYEKKRYRRALIEEV